jgi:DNA mismatch repair protein MutL
VDQHALHERVLYEQFRGRVLSGKVESQKLLVPQTVEMSLKETALLLSHRELLAELGFDDGARIKSMNCTMFSGDDRRPGRFL